MIGAVQPSVFSKSFISDSNIQPGLEANWFTSSSLFESLLLLHPVCGISFSTRFCPLIPPVPPDLQALALPGTWFPDIQKCEGWGPEGLWEQDEGSGLGGEGRLWGEEGNQNIVPGGSGLHISGQFLERERERERVNRVHRLEINVTLGRQRPEKWHPVGSTGAVF